MGVYTSGVARCVIMVGAVSPPRGEGAQSMEHFAFLLNPKAWKLQF